MVEDGRTVSTRGGGGGADLTKLKIVTRPTGHQKTKGNAAQDESGPE